MELLKCYTFKIGENSVDIWAGNKTTAEQTCRLFYAGKGILFMGRNAEAEEREYGGTLESYEKRFGGEEWVRK